MSGHMVAMMRCMSHGGTFACDPETVITIWVDPQTRRPPDVDENGGAVPLPPDYKDWCVQMAICDDCLETRINPDRVARGMDPWPLARDQAGRGGHFGWPQ